MGYRFPCKYCPKQYKTRSSRTNRANKPRLGGRSCIKTDRSADESAPESKRGRIIKEVNRKDLNGCSQRETDKEVRRPHVTLPPSPRPSPSQKKQSTSDTRQEPCKQGQEDRRRENPATRNGGSIERMARTREKPKTRSYKRSPKTKKQDPGRIRTREGSRKIHQAPSEKGRSEKAARHQDRTWGQGIPPTR